jgi:uracil phosphoribosyltransferase
MQQPTDWRPTVVEHPLILTRLAALRRKETGSAEFRRALKEIGLLLAYEATRELATETVELETPLVRAMARVAAETPCLVSVLRAGDGLLAGMIELMPDACVGQVGLRRDHTTLEAIEYFFNAPADLARRPVLVADPMLATGHSAIAAVTRLKDAGARRLAFICILAAPEGLRAFHAAHPDVAVVTAAVDERLDERGYIVPGLGDAGDRLNGTL